MHLFSPNPHSVPTVLSPVLAHHLVGGREMGERGVWRVGGREGVGEGGGEGGTEGGWEGEGGRDGGAEGGSKGWTLSWFTFPRSKSIARCSSSLAVQAPCPQLGGQLKSCCFYKEDWLLVDY